MTISLAAQIEELEYEAGKRRDVYGRMVSAGKMRQSVADLHRARLDAAIGTLRWLSHNETRIKAVLGDNLPEQRG